MYTVKIDKPADWDHANVYALADMHIGDPRSNEAIIREWIEEVKNDPYGLCVLNGDILNTALKNSVSDVYGELMSPSEEIIFGAKLFEPIRDKIVAATIGNHESRVYRNDGIDIMRMVMRELRLEKYYSPEGMIIFLRFGTRCSHDCSKGRSNKQMYMGYITHGRGGGRKEGAKAIRLADMAATIDCDFYIHSHTHLPMTFKQSFYRISQTTSSVQKVEHLFVNTASALDYGGYGQEQEYKPGSNSNPVIHLYADKKKMTATL